MYPQGTWFVSGICVWIPCIKETMMMMMMTIMMMMMMMIIIIIIIILHSFPFYWTGTGLMTSLSNSTFRK